MRVMVSKGIKLMVVAFAAVMLAGCGKSGDGNGGSSSSAKLSTMELRRLHYKLGKHAEAVMRLDRGNGNGEHIDDFTKYYKIGSEALAHSDFAAAQEGLQQAEREVNWLIAAEERRREEERGAEERSREEHRPALSSGDRVLELPGNVQLELVKIEAGTFTMGALDGENDTNEKEHQVTLTRDFYIGKTEVTQAQWQAVMGGNPSRFKGDDLPVEKVSWSDAMEFCDKLNEMGKAPSGWKFTLPTEAQWEYAARGGNKSCGFKYSGGNDVGDVAWYGNSSWNKTHPVAQKRPNELGLYDMSGNGWEWCLDRYESDYARDPEFLTGNSGSKRVSRGGGWFSHAWSCRSADRSYNVPGFRRSYLGFRLALVPVQ